MKIYKKIFISIILLLLPFILSSCSIFQTEADPSTFDDYTYELFYLIIGDDEFTNHFLFKDPDNYGLQPYSSINLPTPGIPTKVSKFLINGIFSDLNRYDYNKLDFDQQMTYNILKNLIDGINNETTEMSYLDSSYLGSYLGYQAQLPLLLSEYAFDDMEDINNYFAFIDLVPETFKSYVDFEIEKADKGYGMPDFVIDNVINQCNEFISDVDNHFLIKTFPDRLNNASFSIDDATKKELITMNTQKVKGPLIEGYTYIKDNLGAIYGKATNNLGLYYYKEGKDYYTHLFKQETGYDIKIEDAITYIEEKLDTSYNSLINLVKNNPDLIDKIKNSSLMNSSPIEQINSFKENIKGLFPEINTYPNINIKYIDKSMENHFSPAAYINSPIDDFSNEFIYLNNASIDGDYNYLYHTLAHEGIPGHLYQNIYFKQQDTNIIRKILKSSGYTEGWATYAEMYSFNFCDEEEKLVAEYLKLNDEVLGALQCRLDMGIHYEGWDADQVLTCLNKYSDNYSIETAEAILKQLIEIPTNSQIYFFTYFKILDMRERVSAALGENFNELEFHKLILDCGPIPLRFVENVVDKYIEEN